MTSSFLICCFLLALLVHTNGHVPSYQSTPSDTIEQSCLLSDVCIHDTVAICGKKGESTRTFLDTCDLLEYACDTGDVYRHIDDQPGCP